MLSTDSLRDLYAVVQLELRPAPCDEGIGRPSQRAYTKPASVRKTNADQQHALHGVDVLLVMLQGHYNSLSMVISVASCKFLTV